MRRILSVLALLAAAGSVDAQGVDTDHLRSQLVAETTAVVPGTPLQLGLLLEHDPHWHTYWKNPGDSGLPTRIALELPAGFSVGAIAWPAPQRFVLGDIVNYGYADRALLPLTIAVPATLADKAVTIRANASWLICATECIPGRAAYALTLPVQPQAAADPRWRDTFAWAAARQPQALPARATMQIDGERIVIDLRGDALPALAAATTFPATPQVFANGVLPAWTRTAEGWRAAWLQSESFAGLPAAAELVLVAGDRAYRVTVAADHAAP